MYQVKHIFVSRFKVYSGTIGLDIYTCKYSFVVVQFDQFWVYLFVYSLPINPSFFFFVTPNLIPHMVAIA